MSGTVGKRAVGAVIVAVVAAAAILGYRSVASGTAFLTSFREAPMLRAGDPVTQSGVTIGKVTGLRPTADGRVEVTAKIDRKHLAETRRESIAFIDETTDGRRQLELYPQDPASPAITKGCRIEGVDGRLELELLKAKARLRPALEDAVEQLRRSTRAIDDFLRSPEARELGEETRRFLDDSRRWADERVQDLRTRHPRFEQDLRDQIEQARRDGNRALLRLLQDLEKRLQEAAPERTPEPAPGQPNAI